MGIIYIILEKNTALQRAEVMQTSPCLYRRANFIG